MTLDEIPVEEGFLSVDKCKKELLFHIKNICEDTSSHIVTQKRIDAIRVLLNLLEKYNNQFAKKGGYL